MAPNFDDKCFVCLKTGGNLNIFTTYNINNDKEELYVEVIKNCFNIEIARDAGLNAMCNECSTKLRVAYTFKSDILEAVNRLVVLQDVVAVEEKEFSKTEYLDDRFENDYDINTVLNPETGQISYTLEKIDENKELTNNEPDTYLIDLESDVIMTKKEAEKIKRVTKSKMKHDDVVKENLPNNIESIDLKSDVIITKNEAEKNKIAMKRKNDDVVKENLPTNIENKEIKVKKSKASGKKVVKETEIAIVDEILPPENKFNKKPAKSRSKKIITIDGDVVSVPMDQEKTKKKRKKVKEAKEPLFTLEPGQTKCTLCCAQFETNKALNTHMNEHFPVHACSECGLAFATRSRLRMHGYQAHIAGPVKCKYCDKSFTNMNTRNTHMWRVHTKTDPFKCAQCGERFKTYLKRLRHMQTAHGETVEYQCQYCDKKFAYAAYRTKHVRTIHLESRPHKCPSCPYSFARRRDLDAHRASKHGDGEMKFQCEVCQRKFFFKSALNMHVSLHNRYTCTQCDAKFSHVRDLEAHIKSHEPTLDLQDTLPLLEDPVMQFDEFADYALDWVLAP